MRIGGRAESLSCLVAGIEIVAEIDRLEPRASRSVPLQPAPRRPALAILLGRPVLWGDELRRERHHPVMAWGTRVAQSTVWKYSLGWPVRLRVEQCGQFTFVER